MQVNNNYQVNFQGLKFNNALNKSVEKEVKDSLYKRLPKEEVDSFLSRLEKSPVETILSLADDKPVERLQANIHYKHPNFKTEENEFIEEGKLRFMFNRKPYNFIHRVLLKLESLEETYLIGRYAK